MKTLQEYGIVELRDGLTLEILQEKYGWVLEAQISDAIIGIYADGIVWYSGIWKNGIFKNGIWQYGRWYGGTFENGIWKGGDVWDEENEEYEYLEKRV